MDQYHLTVYIWLSIAIAVFITLIFVRAPYGRHQRPGWGPTIPARLGWILMEAPCVIVMTVFFVVFAANWWETDIVAITFFVIWMSHYIHRGFVWPARAKITGKLMPLSIIATGILFNGVNAWLNAEWIYELNHPYPIEWLYSWQFILGVSLFITGMIINIKSDNILFKLRQNEGDGYAIPQGGLFRKVSSPNYLGEIIEWIGWAIATWSLAGLTFAIWTIANLAPRARANHKWYHEEFDDYPKERKVLIPYIW